MESFWKRQKVNSEQEFFWLVGLLEGEGCFNLDKSSPRIVISMIDKDIIEYVGQIWGTNVHRREQHGLGTKPMYSTSIQGDTAVRLLRKILPYMSKRRKEKLSYLLKMDLLRPHRKGASKLNKEAAKAIRWAVSAGKLQAHVANVYGISASTVNDIVHERRWSNA